MTPRRRGGEGTIGEIPQTKESKRISQKCHSQGAEAGLDFPFDAAALGYLKNRKCIQRVHPKRERRRGH